MTKGPGSVTAHLEGCSRVGMAPAPPAFLGDHSLLSQTWMCRSGGPEGHRCRAFWAFSPGKAVGLWVQSSLWANTSLLLLGLGLPTPALQALCKLITASETGEQLISRVSPARAAELRPESGAEERVIWP